MGGQVRRVRIQPSIFLGAVYFPSRYGGRNACQKNIQQSIRNTQYSMNVGKLEH